jgi:SAM-dependent methyltransferase
MVMQENNTRALTDRQRWDQRYREGTYAARPWPSAYLRQLCDDRLIQPVGRALDVACGRGRNSLFLSAAGYAVDAVDVSALAIAHAANAAISRQLQVNWQCRDLLAGQQPVPKNTYSLIVMFRFVAPDLLPILLHGLAPGGILVIEEHLQWAGPEQISGPSSQRFRVTADELSTQLGAVGVGFDVLNEFSGLIAEPTDEGEQGKAAVSRMCIRRRST